MTSMAPDYGPVAGRIVLGTRGSPLALWQTRRIAAWLREAGAADIEEAVIQTHGDSERVASLPEIGGKGVFTHALEDALRDGRIDAAVHSLKDLPIEDRPGLRLAAICFRDDARDALVTADGRRLADLPAGAIVGSSSPRRAAQLARARPELVTVPIRGNVETRIARVDDHTFDATILAVAGMRRLGLDARIAECLDIELFVPAPGQGALGVQCRSDDERMLRLLARLDDANARACTNAERAFLAGLGGGCSLPVGAFAWTDGDLKVRGFVGSAARAIDVSAGGAVADAAAIGRGLAHEAIDLGALELLA